MNRRRNQPNRLKNPFLDRIQEHEREWGNDSYVGKPTLAEMLASPVVAFWQNSSGKEKRELVTLHNDTQDVEMYLAKLVLRSGLTKPDRTLITVYQNQKRLRIKGFKIVFEPVDEPE